MENSPSPSPFLQACNQQIPALKPVWLMRQAGRILKPYRDLKEKTGSLLELFQTPDLAAEITLMPVEMLGVDAAILFTDLVTPLEPMGCPFKYAPGPVCAHPARTRKEVEALRPMRTEADLPFVLETIRLVRRALPASVPLIGYGGGPFTLATWATEGESSREFAQFRRLVYADPQTAHLLLDKLTEVTIDYLRAQIRAGAQAIQVFDTSVGVLSPPMFEQVALPYLQRVFAALEELRVPRIYFALGASHLLHLLPRVGADVLSLDWRTDISRAFRLVDGKMALQGNLDPCALLAPAEAFVREAQNILRQTAGQPHIFNLGHGVLPDTPFDHVRLLVETVHEYSAATAKGG